jgi:hypothetical protein
MGMAAGDRYRLLQRGIGGTGVDVDAADHHPVPAGVGDQALRHVEAHRLVVQQRHGERGRVVPLEVGAGVDEVGEAVGVGLGEAVAGEPEELAVDVLGDVGRDVLGRHSVQQPLTQLLDPFR